MGWLWLGVSLLVQAILSFLYCFLNFFEKRISFMILTILSHPEHLRRLGRILVGFCVFVELQ